MGVKATALFWRPIHRGVTHDYLVTQMVDESADELIRTDGEVSCRTPSSGESQGYWVVSRRK